LTNEGKGNARLAIAMHRASITHDRTRRINAQIARPREFAGNQRIARRTCRWYCHGESRQNGMTGQGCFEALIRQSGNGEAKRRRKQKVAQLEHGNSSSIK
jgi:hypothetical protein